MTQKTFIRENGRNLQKILQVYNDVDVDLAVNVKKKVHLRNVTNEQPGCVIRLSSYFIM